MSDKKERARLYDIMQGWMNMARRSANDGDRAGELHALEYVRDLVKTLRKCVEGDAE